MASKSFVRRSRLPVSALEAFRWHARPGALERLMPPWEPASVLERSGDGIEPGARVVLKVPLLGPLGLRWVAEHTEYEEGRLFKDVQVSGPFARWEHTHRFEPDGEGACWLEDSIEYAVPLGLPDGGLLRSKLERMFDYRHAVTRADLEAHARAGLAPRKILVSGASGLIGSALLPFLGTGGHKVERLPRAARPEQLEGADAVIHLAGESLVGRWTAAKKREILRSREEGTRRLCEALAALPQPPKVFLGASAVGWYGSRGEERLEESSGAGGGFLAEVCRRWEEAAAPMASAGARVVNLRLGVVLDPRGGALGKMLPAFGMGAGGPVGPGTQYLSWISLDDVLGAMLHALATESLRGPVNLTAPTPATSLELAQTLGRVLGRPALLRAPAAPLKLLFGEMAEETLLASQRALPSRLLASGYEFRHPTLEGALRHMLGR